MKAPPGTKASPGKIAKYLEQHVKRAVVKQKSSILRAWGLAADSSITSEERVPKLIELARTLNAIRSEIAQEEVARGAAQFVSEKGIFRAAIEAGTEFGLLKPAPGVPQETGPEHIARLSREEALRHAPVSPFAQTVDGIGRMEFGRMP
jgi:hypothetical protein